MANILIVVPTLNSSHLLRRQVDSLCHQTFSRWRVLFVDGHSQSDHKALLDEICSRDSRFSMMLQSPSCEGIFGAMNQGCAAAKQNEWLLFWGSDDFVADSDVLARAVNAKLVEYDLILCRGRYVRVQPNHLVYGRKAHFRMLGNFRCSLFLGSSPVHQATLIGPKARLRLESYDDRFQIAADLDYFLQLSEFSDLRIKVLDLELVHMGEGGVSGVKHRRRFQEVLWAYQRAFGWLWPIPFVLRYVQRALTLIDKQR